MATVEDIEDVFIEFSDMGNDLSVIKTTKKLPTFRLFISKRDGQDRDTWMDNRDELINAVVERAAKANALYDLQIVSSVMKVGDLISFELGSPNTIKRCIGITKSGRQCSLHITGIYCHHHKK